MRCIEMLHSIQNGEHGVRLIETWDVLKYWPIMKDVGLEID